MSLSPVSLVKNPLYQASYKQQAINLILSIKGASDVIVSGPTIFLEGPLFRPGRYKDRRILFFFTPFEIHIRQKTDALLFVYAR